MVNQQIIALGGGGFSMEESPVLDDYILRACKKDNPRICFVPTASTDSDTSIVRFYRRFAATHCRATDLQLFQRRVADLEDFACSQDVIYVSGGNTVNMLAVWRAHAFDRALKAALSSGTVLAGISAGSICWFEQGVTDSFGPELQHMDCLGFLSGSNCLHYDGEVTRRPAYHRLVASGMLGGYAADDGVGLHFINGCLRHVVSSRPEAKGYKVELHGSTVIETPYPARQLRQAGRCSCRPGSGMLHVLMMRSFKRKERSLTHGFLAQTLRSPPAPETFAGTLTTPRGSL